MGCCRGQRLFSGTVVARSIAEAAEVLLNERQVASGSDELQQTFAILEVASRVRVGAADLGTDAAYAQRPTFEETAGTGRQLAVTQQVVGG